MGSVVLCDYPKDWREAAQPLVRPPCSPPRSIGGAFRFQHELRRFASRQSWLGVLEVERRGPGIRRWRLDRLARNMVDGGEIILSKGRLKEIVTPEATYTGTPNSKFMLAMLFGAAAKYTDDLSSAVKCGNRAVYKEGRITERSPIGYLKVREKAGRRGASPVEKDPERVDLVRGIWDAVLEGTMPILITQKPTARGGSASVLRWASDAAILSLVARLVPELAGVFITTTRCGSEAGFCVNRIGMEGTIG